MEDIIITNHTIERFVERFSRITKSVPKNPEESIRKLLKHVVLEEMDPVHRVIRLINNGSQDVSYFTHAGWRFVIAGNVLVTVERMKGYKS